MKGIVLTAMDDEIYEVLSDNEIFADLFNGALFGGNPVSYTHLDVYKRQSPICPV